MTLKEWNHQSAVLDAEMATVISTQEEVLKNLLLLPSPARNMAIRCLDLAVSDLMKPLLDEKERFRGEFDEIHRDLMFNKDKT